MKLIKKILKHVPYGIASVFGVLGLVFIVPGGILVLVAISWATWGDKLTSFEWRNR